MTGPHTASGLEVKNGRVTDSRLHAPVLTWYAANRRELPWRSPDACAWSVLVSEVMLQQTPVARVLPVFEEWLRRWPRPADLAADTPAQAIRLWGALGYPRRALRLHAAANVIVRRHGGPSPPTPKRCWSCRESGHTPQRRLPRSLTGSGRSCSTPTCAGSWPV